MKTWVLMSCCVVLAWGCRRVEDAADTASPNANDPAAGDADGDGDGDGDSDGDADSDADSDADADCTDVSPCGGDVAGTWDVTASCFEVSGELDMTPLGLGNYCSPQVTGSLGVTGTWTANADGTYSDSTTTTGEVRIDMPCTCLEFDGSCISCSRFGEPLTYLGYAAVTCEEDPKADSTDCRCGGPCICTAFIDQVGRMAVVAPGFPETSGDYTTENNTFTVTDSSDPPAYSYCVDGTTLGMTPVSSGTTGTLTGTVELQRQ